MTSRGRLISIQCRCHLISDPSKALMILVSVSISYITIYTVKYTHAHFIRCALLVLGWTLFGLQTCFNVIQIQQGAESITQRWLYLMIHNLVSDSTTAQRCTDIWWLWKAIHRELISRSSNRFEMIWALWCGMFPCWKQPRWTWTPKLWAHHPNIATIQMRHIRPTNTILLLTTVEESVCPVASLSCS